MSVLLNNQKGFVLVTDIYIWKLCVNNLCIINPCAIGVFHCFWCFISNNQYLYQILFINLVEKTGVFLWHLLKNFIFWTLLSSVRNKSFISVTKDQQLSQKHYFKKIAFLWENLINSLHWNIYIILLRLKMALKIDEYLRIAGMILGGLGAIGSIIYFCAYISIFFEEEKEPSKFSWFLSIFLTLGILLCVFYFLLCILLIKGILDVSIIVVNYWKICYYYLDILLNEFAA